MTQATISRDIAELGLVKVARGDRHVYISTDDLAPRLAERPATRTIGSAGSSPTSPSGSAGAT